MYFGRVQKILVVLVVKFVWGAGLMQELTNYMMLSGFKVLKKKNPHIWTYGRPINHLRCANKSSDGTAL